MSKLSDPGYIEDVLRRLESIPQTATPQWGTLDKTGMIEHLVYAVRGPMGQTGKKTPPFDTFALRNIIGPLILNGLVPMPKNLQIKDGDQPMDARVHGATLDDLRASLEEFVSRIDDPSFEVGPHPAFGPIGVQGWNKLHYRHIEHHCKQFAV